MFDHRFFRLAGRASVVAFILLLHQRLATPQAGSGTIVGTVTDESGAAVSDASVTLTNTGTGFTRAVTTNASGQYVAPAIPTGTYTIAAEKAGFRKLIREGIQAHGRRHRHGQSDARRRRRETDHRSNAPARRCSKRRTPTSPQLIDNRRIVEMPLNGRTFTSLLLLTPGAHAGSSSNLATRPPTPCAAAPITASTARTPRTTAT